MGSNGIDWGITDPRPEVQARIDRGADHRERKYEIVRFYHPRLERRPRRTGSGPLTEAEAQAHCHDPKTRREGEYFDGYQIMKGFK